MKKSKGYPTVLVKSDCGRFTYSVYKTFVLKFGEMTDTPYNLQVKYSISDYLHNDSGPAVIDHTNKTEEYWIDGRYLTVEEAARYIQYAKFYDRMDDLINEDD